MDERGLLSERWASNNSSSSRVAHVKANHNEHLIRSWHEFLPNDFYLITQAAHCVLNHASILWDCLRGILQLRKCLGGLWGVLWGSGKILSFFGLVPPSETVKNSAPGERAVPVNACEFPEAPQANWLENFSRPDPLLCIIRRLRRYGSSLLGGCHA